MTDPQFTALVDALPAIITALGVLTTVILAALTRKRDGKVDEKVDKLVSVTEQIHTVTNSNLSAITAELKQANSKIDGLEKWIAAMDKAKVVADNVSKTLAEKVEPPKTTGEPSEMIIVNPDPIVVVDAHAAKPPKTPSKK